MKFVGLKYEIYRMLLVLGSDSSKRKPKRSELYQDARQGIEISPYGGAVKVIETVVNDKGVRIGSVSAISYCSTGDLFDLKEGKRIALLRLVEIKVFLPYPPPSPEVWRESFKVATEEHPF